MTVIEIQVLRCEIDDGFTKRPIFIGALPVQTLNNLADVPSFTSATAQYEIADHILHPPIKNWQRPLDEKKTKAIAERFDQNGEFMPNPVLLAVHRSELVQVETEVKTGVYTGVYTLKVTMPVDGDRPLWVLDGQHRLRGLADSSQYLNPIPFVLLHSENVDVYSPEIFAKIFAEVSTEATQLSELHREWLQYAFNLGIYDVKSPGKSGQNAQLERLSMEAVAILCKTQNFDENLVNPYFNKIQFNPAQTPAAVYGEGFAFDAPTLKDLILDEYFRQPSADSRKLRPGELAREIAGATVALTRSVTTPTDKSSFSGMGNKHQLYIERGFVCAVVSRLLKNPKTNWARLLEDLKFPTTDWDLTWVKTTGGAAGTISKRIARNVFVEAFGLSAIPHGSDNLVTYLRGDKTSATFVASEIGPRGRPANKDKKMETFEIAGVSVFDTGGRQHVKLQKGDAYSTNIGKLQIYDPKQPFAKDYTFSVLKRGVTLPERVELMLRAETYGGLAKEMTLDINPKSK
jgi:DGQHR domain-containing protein